MKSHRQLIINTTLIIIVIIYDILGVYSCITSLFNFVTNMTDDSIVKAIVESVKSGKMTKEALRNILKTGKCDDLSSVKKEYRGPANEVIIRDGVREIETSLEEAARLLGVSVECDVPISSNIGVRSTSSTRSLS